MNISYNTKFHESLCRMFKSAIHKAAIQHSASGWNDAQMSFQPPAPFMAHGSFRNSTRQNHGMAGNREAGGFVNSAVTKLSVNDDRPLHPGVFSQISILIPFTLDLLEFTSK